MKIAPGETTIFRPRAAQSSIIKPHKSVAIAKGPTRGATANRVGSLFVPG